MSILRKKGQAALTRRQQRRAHGNRGTDPESRLEARGGRRRLQDVPQPRQPGYEAAYARSRKGLVKLDERVRYEMWGGSKTATWTKRRRRAAAQRAAEGAKAR